MNPSDQGHQPLFHKPHLWQQGHHREVVADIVLCRARRVNVLVEMKTSNSLRMGLRRFGRIDVRESAWWVGTTQSDGPVMGTRWRSIANSKFHSDRSL